MMIDGFPVHDDADPMLLFEKMSREELIFHIKESAQTLVARSEVLQAPDQEDYRFPISLSETKLNLHVPFEIYDKIGLDSRINGIIIVGNFDATKFESELCVMLEASDNLGRAMTATCRPCGIDAEVTINYGIDDQEIPSGTIDRKHLTRLIASIFAPNRTGDYSAFDSLDLNDYEIAYNIMLALEKHTDDVDVTVRIPLTLHGEAGPWIDYDRINGEIVNIKITRLEDGEPIMILDLSTLENVVVESDGEIFIDGGIDVEFPSLGKTPPNEDPSKEDLMVTACYLEELLVAAPEQSLEKFNADSRNLATSDSDPSTMVEKGEITYEGKDKTSQ